MSYMQTKSIKQDYPISQFQPLFQGLSSKNLAVVYLELCQKLHVETFDKTGKKRLSLCKKPLFYRSCRRFLHAIFGLPNGKTKIACRNRLRQIKPFCSKVAYCKFPMELNVQKTSLLLSLRHKKLSL